MIDHRADCKGDCQRDRERRARPERRNGTRFECQQGLALTLDLPVDKVRAIYTAGSGSYGRNDADDCAMDAAILAKAIGKPVRLQYMREQGTGWDPKGRIAGVRIRRVPFAPERVKSALS